MENNHNCNLCKHAKIFPKIGNICYGKKYRGKVIEKDDTICEEYEFGGFVELSEKLSKIGGLIKGLRDFGKIYNIADYEITTKMMNDAADIIERLSVKLQAKEYCSGCPGADIIEIPCTEECKRRHFQVKNMEHSAEYCGYGWIPCKYKLPEEKINPITNDYYEYQVTYKNGDVTDIRHYKFGDSHWWNSGQNMDKYVVAWRELPQVYEEVEDD